jgi:peptidoglycan/LPS O-acetylase OafA/YrhL
MESDNASGHELPVSRLGYVPALDGIRGIAVLAVWGFHYLGDDPDPIPDLLQLRGGHHGVDIFFTLSGFLITTLLVEEYQRRGSIDLRAFWLRRALRLLPALLLVLGVLALLGVLVDAGYFPAGQGLRSGPIELPTGDVALPYWQGFLVTLLPISNWAWVNGFIFNPLAHAWTLAIEDQFYLVWPFALLLLLTRWGLTLRRTLALVAALAIFSAFWGRYLLSTGTPFFHTVLRTDTRAVQLLIGCALGLAFTSGLIPTNPRSSRLLGGLAWTSLVALLATFFVTRYVDFTIVVLLTTALMVHLVIDRDSVLSAALSWPLLVGIGEVSYGIYLWHRAWMSYTPAEGTVRFFAMIALTVISVLVSYYVVERPALRLKDRFARVTPDHVSSDGRGDRSLRVSRRDTLPVATLARLMKDTSSAQNADLRASKEP